PSYVVPNDGSFSVRTGQELGGANVTYLGMSWTYADCPTQSTGEGWQGTCVLPALAPGATMTVTVLVGYTGPCPGSSIAIYFWAFSRWWDTNTANNGESTRTIHC
ncbi:hypothetical protein, partial [Nocardioides sp.]|uniref:hypothetical protein n=1 Tax=Nocardioides sp. TaxID=35761 RepID=UPI0025DA6944